MEKWVYKKFAEWKLSKEYSEWKKTFNIPNPIEETKPKPSKQEITFERLLEAQEHIKKIRTKLERLQTNLKKWEKIERKLSLKIAQTEETTTIKQEARLANRE